MTAVWCTQARELLSAKNATARRIAEQRAQWTAHRQAELLLNAAARKLELSLRDDCDQGAARCPLKADRRRLDGCEITGGKARVKALLIEATLDQWRSERRSAAATVLGSAGRPRQPWRDVWAPSERLGSRLRQLQQEKTSVVFPGVDDRNLDCVLLAVELRAGGEVDDTGDAVERAAATCGLRVADRSSRRARQRFDRLVADVESVLKSLGLVDR